MVSEQFRQQLRQEVEQWRAEGLIDDALERELARRYQFSGLETAASNRFITFLLGLGSILVGLAAITFVAANWQVWPKEVKAAFITAVWAIATVGGFILWNRAENTGRSRLGHGLLLMGMLVMGADLGFISQMFHQSGPGYGLFLLWGIGTMAMAFALRLTSLGVSAAILLGISYGGGIIDRVAGTGMASPIMEIVRHFPLLVAGLLVPLAYCCRSPWLFGLVWVEGILAFVMNIGLFLRPFYQLSPLTGGIVFAIAVCLPATLGWAYRDSLWFFRTEGADFGPIARRIATIVLGINFYLLSFNVGLWQETFTSNVSDFTADDWLMLVDQILLGSATIWAWWQLGLRRDRRLDDRLGWQIDLSSTAFAALLSIAGLYLSVHWAIGINPVVPIILFNLLLFLLAAGCIRDSLDNGHRLGFWGGVLAIVFQVLTRTLEYDTGLLLKAFILLLCGVGVIVAGLWFERYLRHLPDSASEPPNPS